jgi:hypothetical protein
MDIVEKINNHLRTLSPHVAKRETAALLRAAIDEIERLRNPKLINPVKNPRYDDVYDAGIKMLDDA